MAAVEADTEHQPTDFSGIINGDVWYWGLRSYIDLLYQSPALDQHARGIVASQLQDFQNAGRALRSRIDGFDTSNAVKNYLYTYDGVFDSLLQSTLQGLRANAPSDIPDAFLAGFGLEESLLAARCDRVMPNFFVKYHEEDTDGLLLSVCAEGTPIDFQRAGIGLVSKMPLSFKDMVVAADAMGLIQWQFEERQSPGIGVDDHSSLQQVTDEPPIRHIIHTSFWPTRAAQSRYARMRS